MYKLSYNDYDRKVYETELKDFLPDEFIDLHVHLWKNTFTPNNTATDGSTWPQRVADEILAEDMIETFKVLFPDKKVGALCFGDVNTDVHENNVYLHEKSKEFGFPILLRTDYKMTAEEIEEDVKRYNCIGLKPYITNCPPYIPPKEVRIFDFLPHEHLEVANKHGWIVMLHIPRALRLKDPVNLAQLMEIEEKYPNLKLVVAHVGRAYSKQDMGDAFEVLKNTKNMFFEFTANLCDDAIRECIKTVGTKRFMYGSDLPISIMRMYRIVDENGFYQNVIPKGLYGDVSSDPHMKEVEGEDITLMIYEQLLAFKRVAQDLKLSDKDVEDIMFNNAKKLIESVK